jgi:large subunit ribosomal protein L15
MLTLKTLNSPKGAHRNSKRIGRGQGSGQGTQAGKGHKGQKARKSGQVRIGFEGGTMPIFMRLPKRGFKNEPFKQKFAEVTLAQLDKYFAAGDKVDKTSLNAKGLLKGVKKQLPIKILGTGKLTKKLSFAGIEKFTTSSLEQVKKLGCQL